MSMQYWGIVMHGVNENNLKIKENDYEYGLSEIFETEAGGNHEFSVTLPSGKKVILDYEPTEEDNYFGFYAGYPWEKYMQGLTEQDVNDAIWQFLSPYLDMTKKELMAVIENISTYNCG